MGELRNRVIQQSRQWLDPNTESLPDWDYNYIYPITVFDAVKRTTDDTSSTLTDEIESIYRLIDGKQNIVEPGISGNLMTWTGVRGQIGSTEVVKSISTEKATRSNAKIPTEKAVGDALDTKTPLSTFNTHVTDNSIHVTDIERSKWNSMAPLSKLQSHISNVSVHITEAERGKWNNKAEAADLEGHIYDMNNPHNVTAHQAGTYTRSEIDEMFGNLRESFFNYKNIIWDNRTREAELVDYDAANWNPNYVLGFNDTLPDVPDPDLTYFALKPATDYNTNETQDIVIYAKIPGMAWQEVGFQAMEVGDMVIKYPDTIMYTWVQGRFIRLFTDSSADDIDDNESDMLWRPYIDDNGDLAWIKSKEVVPPAPMTIKGEDGYTPIKGIDYVDGVDGVGVPIGGITNEILVKMTDENFDTNWKSLMDILNDLVIAGEVLPEGIVVWDNIKGKPEWYQELGDHDDGFVSQKVITKQFDILTNKLNDLLDMITILNNTKSDFEDHVNDFNNPHRVTPSMIGAVPVATFTDHIQNYLNPHNVTAAQVGLGNVNNTADLDKPISNAVQDALDEIWEKVRLITGDVDDIVYIKDALWNNNDSSIHFTRSDGDEFNVRIPIPEIFNSIYYDAETKELVIILPNGEENRINIAELIVQYFGSTSPNIQVIIEDNTIKATVVPNSIGELEIAYSVNLRGSPTTTTQPISDNSTRIATTEFIHNEVIDNLISYENDRPLSANMGRILNQRKADIEDVINIINDLEGVNVVDNLNSTSPVAALSANMGRHLDLTKAPRFHTSPEGSTFGRSTISVFGHSKAADTDPLMDGTVFRGTDDGIYARGDHRHPTDITRAPIHWPDVAHDQYAFTGEPRSTLPPDDSNDDRIVTTEWVRRNASGVYVGECLTSGSSTIKTATLKSSFLEDPIFIQQIGSSVAITFLNDNTSTETISLAVQGNDPGPIIYDGGPVRYNMIKGNHTYLFTYDGSYWKLINPSGWWEEKDYNFLTDNDIKSIVDSAFD